MQRRKIMLAVSVAAVALLAGACSIDVERNADGSLAVSAVMTEQSIQQELEQDPQNDNVVVDIVDGYILVEADRTERNGTTAAVSFRADIALENDDLVVEVSDATYDGFSIPQSFVDLWNDGLAQALRRAANQHPDASLLSVELANDEMATEWRLETPDSRN